MTKLLLYLSQEGKMLNNQMRALCFPSTALPTDYDTLKQRETNQTASKEYLHYIPYIFFSLFKQVEALQSIKSATWQTQVWMFPLIK